MGAFPVGVVVWCGCDVGCGVVGGSDGYLGEFFFLSIFLSCEGEDDSSSLPTYLGQVTYLGRYDVGT